MAVAEPASASSFKKRANVSTTKLPPKAMSLSPGSQTTMAPAATSSTMASQLTAVVLRSPRNAPSISSTMAPTARTISGRAGKRSWNSKASFIGGPVERSRHQHGRSLGGAERLIVVVEQLSHRSRRHIEYRLGEEAERDGQQSQRPERDDLAIVKVLDGGELGLVEDPEDHLAIEPQRIGRRQDDAARGECRDPGVHLEGADEREELADKARRSWQSHIGEGEHHEGDG